MKKFSENFSEKVSKQLKYYVYRLVDPRNGQTFYVGKGKNNRVFSHAKGEVKDEDENELDEKLKRIREIEKDNFEVMHIIHRHGLEDEATAFEIEAALIDAYPEALNKVAGHDSNEYGLMHAEQVIKQYEAEEIDFQHKVLMISVNRSFAEANDAYEAVRSSWKVDPKRAEKSDFVLALQHGLVIGAFVATKWLKATDGKGNISDRWEFVGKEAPDEIKNLYLDKRLPDSMRKKGAANPIRYSYE